MESSEVNPSSKMSGFVAPKGLDGMKGMLPDSDIETVDGLEEFGGEQEEVRQAGTSQDEGKKGMSYEDKVKSFGLSIEEAHKIIDSLMVEGYYAEKEQISKKVHAVFSTRSTRFNDYLSEIIDAEEPKKVGRLSQLMSKYQLAGSLISLGEHELAPLQDAMDDETWKKMLNQRLKFVGSLPAPVFTALCNKLSVFDGKMIVIFSEGYDENF